MGKFERIWDRIEDTVIGVLAGCALALICYEVVVRYFIPAWLPDWGAEFTIYFTVWAMLIAGGSLVTSRQHIRADLLVRSLPERLQWLLELVSLIIGLPLGIAFGVLAGMNRRIANALEPLGIFANSISGIAWLPLAIVWFGIGTMTTIFILLNTIFWLVFFNTLLGVRGVPRVYENSVRTLGGNRWNVITQVYFPGAMPSIITGMRMSMGFGWRALIAAEMIGGDSGLGFMIFVSAQEFKIEEVFLGVIVISLIWMATDRYLLMPLEKWTVHRWGLVWKPV